MSGVYIAGLGAVSPAGWNMAALRDALAKGQLLPSQELPRPGLENPLRVMRVPPANPRPGFLSHARLRRTSPITQFAVAAALEALGERAPGTTGEIGVVLCVFSGCVNYSRRFYDETLKDPATASPLVFPETVFNAPASHISAFLGSTAINYTLVGDSGTFLVGLATAARWITEGRVSECVVVGTEEVDWLTSDAVRLFDRSKFLSEGAGAVLLKNSGPVELRGVTDEVLYGARGKKAALALMKEELCAQTVGIPPEEILLCDSTSHASGISREESEFWSGWTGPRVSPRKVLGEGLMAAAAWQVVAAADALTNSAWVGSPMAVGRREGAKNKVLAPAPRDALISIAGFHQQAIGASLRAV